MFIQTYNNNSSAVLIWKDSIKKYKYINELKQKIFHKFYSTISSEYFLVKHQYSMSWSFLKYNYIFITNLTRKFYLSQAIIQRSAKVLLLLLFRPFLNTSSWKLPYGTSAFVQGLRSTCIVNRRYKLLTGHKNWFKLLSTFNEYQCVHVFSMNQSRKFSWIYLNANQKPRITRL